MNPGLKIGILLAAGIAYLMSNKTTTLQEELEKLRNAVDNGQAQIDELQEQVERSPEDIVRDSIQITPYLDFGGFDTANWSVRLTWKLKNVSQYTYVITGIKSVVTLCGYTCKYWMPGNTSEFITLRPGQSVEIMSEKDNITLYDSKEVREKIRSAYYNEYNYVEGLDTVTVLRVQNVYGGSRIVNYEDCRGYIRNLKGVTWFSNRNGENMVGKEL